MFKRFLILTMSLALVMPVMAKSNASEEQQFITVTLIHQGHKIQMKVPVSTRFPPKLSQVPGKPPKKGPPPHAPAHGYRDNNPDDSTVGGDDEPPEK